MENGKRGTGNGKEMTWERKRGKGKEMTMGNERGKKRQWQRKGRERKVVFFLQNEMFGGERGGFPQHLHSSSFVLT